MTSVAYNIDQDGPLETLKLLAESKARFTGKNKRPVWAPPMVLPDELVDLWRNLPPKIDSLIPVARLWANFLNPTRTGGKVVCHGFELRLGVERKGPVLFQSMFYNGQWCSGPRYEVPEGESLSEAGKRWAARVRLLARSVELAAQRVTDFAGDPDKQMRLGGIAASRCCFCGRKIWDKISLEVGIGSECRGGRS
jgi:hypothetical protein